MKPFSTSHYSILLKFGTKITLILTKIQVKELELYDQRGPRSRNPKEPKNNARPTVGKKKQPAVASECRLSAVPWERYHSLHYVCS